MKRVLNFLPKVGDNVVLENDTTGAADNRGIAIGSIGELVRIIRDEVMMTTIPVVKFGSDNPLRVTWQDIRLAIMADFAE